MTQTTHTQSPLLTRPEAARYLRVSVSHLDRLVRRGDLSAVKYGRRGSRRARVLFERVNLDAFIAGHRTGPGAENGLCRDCAAK